MSSLFMKVISWVWLALALPGLYLGNYESAQFCLIVSVIYNAAGSIMRAVEPNHS